MDADLKAYLDTMQKALTQQMTQLNAETRKDLTEQIVSVRQEARQLNAETRKDLTEQIASVRQEARQLNAETRRELGTLIEAVHDDVKLLAEAVAINNDRMTALLTDHEKRITHLEERRG